MHKTHIGRTGPGTTPRCSKGFGRCNGVSASLEQFEQTPEACRCARCNRLLPKLQQMRAKEAAARARAAKSKAYLTSAEAQAMGFPTVDEQIKRFNKAVRTSRAAALYQEADRQDARIMSARAFGRRFNLAHAEDLSFAFALKEARA